MEDQKMKNISAAVVVLCLVLGTAVQADQGKAVYEVWSNITGTAVSDLTNVAQYPIFPTSRRLVDLFEAPLDYADNYGARLSAWIVPPVSGAYKFWIASDDASELYLSTNDDPANAVAIASVSGWTPSRDFEHLASDGVTREYPNQGPVTRTLIAGRPYYICALHKESTGGDNCAVAWQGPGFARRVIGEGFPADLWSDNPKGASPASPNPYSGELAPLNVQLSWVDPDAAFATGVTYDVYFSTDPNLPTAVISGQKVNSYDPGPLAYDTTYYWRVDTIGTDPNIGGPLFVRGTLWSFTTVNQRPVFTVQPQGAATGTSCQVELTVDTYAVGTQVVPTYEWYKVASGGDIYIGSGKTIYLLVQDASDAGDYYCIATNFAGSTRSNNATITVSAPGVLAGTGDIGYVPESWETTYTNVANGVYEMASASGDPGQGEAQEIWGTKDGFRYAYAHAWGDCDIIARVADWRLGEHADRNNWAWDPRVGVMIRETLDPDSKNVMLSVAAKRGFIMQYRSETGGSTTGPNGNDGVGPWPDKRYWLSYFNPTTETYEEVGILQEPKWVRLVREGDTFTGYYSYDGITWTLHNQTTISMAEDVYVGLAITTWAWWIVDTVKFDNVEVRTAAGVARGGDLYNTVEPVNVQPARGTTGVDPDEPLVLSWEAYPLSPCDVHYNVYWSADPAGIVDFNSVLSIPIATTEDTFFVIDAAQLESDATCYWRVATVYNGDIIPGDLRTLQTRKLKPVITQQPSNRAIWPGESTEMSVGASSGEFNDAGPLSYQWYKDGVSMAPQGQSPALTLSDIAHEGEYYCVVSNAYGSLQTNTVAFAVKRLLAHYPLDDASDPENIVEATGQQAPGRLRGNVTTVPGMVGNAFSFGGAEGDYIDIGNWNPSRGSNELTISHWVAWDSDGGTGWQGSIGKRDNWAADDMMWQIELAKTNNGFLEPKHYGNDPASFGYNVPGDLTWVHYLLTFDGSTAAIYINGELIATAPWSLGPDTTAAMTIGACNANGYNPWRGYIDDVYIYNYALNPFDAARHYTDVTGQRVCPQKPAYDFNSDCYTDLKDFAILLETWMACNIVPDCLP
jgi:hypothetical protein